MWVMVVEKKQVMRCSNGREGWRCGSLKPLNAKQHTTISSTLMGESGIPTVFLLLSTFRT